MVIKGKRVVITGASSGIGYAFARRLAKAGARVVGVSRNPQDVIDALGDLGVLAVGCDVSEPEQVDALLEESKRLLGGIDVFVANAGFAYYGILGSPDWDRSEKIFKTNVLSPIYTLQKLAQGRNEPLVFMVTISALGKMVLPGFALYDATKFAMDGFVRTYRMEKPKNIKIMPVYPVATLQTRFFKKASGVADSAPVPLPPQPVSVVAFCMEMGLRMGARSVYTSLVFLVRCLLVRVLPVDLIPQAIERVRFSAWRKKHQL